MVGSVKEKWFGWNFGLVEQNSVEIWSPRQFFHVKSLENWSISGKMIQSIKHCSLLTLMNVQELIASGYLLLGPNTEPAWLRFYAALGDGTDRM